MATNIIDTLASAARAYSDVTEGVSCTQTSFKTNGKAFLYLGEQGGRLKAMFKLNDSLPHAQELADQKPDDIQLGKHGWVTARFTTTKPLPAKLWKKWLKESYTLASS